MRHLGDITKLSGMTVPITDCVIGGSPCQGLSIAGQRAGLQDERSGLFMEQIRMVKEMRQQDARNGKPRNLTRPRFMLWESVPGAFSSNRGYDFKAVLEETIRIAEPDAPDIPLPPKGKWPVADCWYGDGWSIAYRVFDAEFWGTPQRRRRIALVADFGGHAAPEILFVRKGVCWDFGESETPWKAYTADAGGSPPEAVTLRMRAGCEGGGKGALLQVEKSGTLGCNNDQTVFCFDRPIESQVYENHGQDSHLTGPLDVAPTVAQKFGTGGNNTPLVLTMATGQANAEISENLAPTLNCNHEAPIVATFQNTGQGWWNEGDVGATVRTPCGGDATKANLVLQMGYARRMTPLECERLQGFPDGWTDIGDWTDTNGKVHKSSDTARYKALGNSIALPPWRWVIKRLCGIYERPATMASLFDGIGGFPLIWEQFNGQGSAVWASEIEEFPMAVTRIRFPETAERK